MSKNTQAHIQKMLRANEKAAANVVRAAARESAKAGAALAAAKAAHEKALQDAGAIQARHYKRFLAMYKADLLHARGPLLIRQFYEAGHSFAAIAKHMHMPIAKIKALLAQVLRGPLQPEWLIEDQKVLISYQNEGRGGNLILKWGDRSGYLWYEIGGSNVLLWLSLPSAERWEAQTGIPAQYRAQLIPYIAMRFRNDQAPDHDYDIKNDSVVIYENR